MTIPVAVSDTVQVWTLFFGFLGTVFGGIMTYLMARLNYRQEVRGRQQADQAEMVRRDLRETNGIVHSQILETGKVINEQGKVIDGIYKLANSGTGAPLGVIAMMARRLARDGDPNDIAVAEAAEKAYRDHEATQKSVDQAGLNPSLSTGRTDDPTRPT